LNEQGQVQYTLVDQATLQTICEAFGPVVGDGMDSPYVVQENLQVGVTYEWLARSYDGKYYSLPSDPQTFSLEPTPPDAPPGLTYPLPWQPLELTFGVVTDDHGNIVTTTASPTVDGGIDVAASVLDQTGNSSVILCHIDTAGWRLSGPWQAETVVGAWHCSTPVYHSPLTSKLVKKHWYGWHDYSGITIRRPSSGYAYDAAQWWVNYPYLTVAYRDTGRYHVHVTDTAHASNGSTATLINADGADFLCGTNGCYYE
jgi:hypothetical protein